MAGQTAGSKEIETAYYYPEPYWHGSESADVKSLLLFFDEIAILLPRYMTGRPFMEDPSLVEPLVDRGLLRILRPETFVDQHVAESLAEVVVGLLANGVFDDLPRNGYFSELSNSRLGHDADVDLSSWLVKELKRAGLARRSKDGASIPLQPVVRETILVVISQLARAAGRRHGLDLHPATSSTGSARELVATLTREAMPSVGHVVRLDLERVTINLDSIPLEDVLAFREDHANEYQDYRRNLEGLLTELGPLPAEERDELLVARQDELIEAANSLRKGTRRAFRNVAGGWTIGLAGAAWSATTGDPIGALFSAAGLTWSAVESRHDSVVGAYSYLFGAESSLR